jgi:hypothetical protein
MKLTDRSVKALLSTIAVLLAANLFLQLLPSPRPALAAGVPDTGAQLQAVVDAVQDLNKKLDKTNSILESGTLTVKIKDAKSDK